MTTFWENIGGNNLKRCIQILLDKLQSTYERDWLKYIQGEQRNSNKLRTYCKFKNKFVREEYLNMNLPLHKRKRFTKIRISAHDLKVEMGRYNRTPLENRTCSVCAQIEDETHFMLHCIKNNNFRQQLFTKLHHYNPQQMLPDDQFKFLMTGSSGDHLVIKEVVKFINLSYEAREGSQ